VDLGVLYHQPTNNIRGLPKTMFLRTGPMPTTQIERITSIWFTELPQIAGFSACRRYRLDA
jgi:hypothetical protein